MATNREAIEIFQKAYEDINENLQRAYLLLEINEGRKGDVVQHFELIEVAARAMTIYLRQNYR